MPTKNTSCFFKIPLFLTLSWKFQTFKRAGVFQLKIQFKLKKKQNDAFLDVLSDFYLFVGATIPNDAQKLNHGQKNGQIKHVGKYSTVGVSSHIRTHARTQMATGAFLRWLVGAGFGVGLVILTTYHEGENLKPFGWLVFSFHFLFLRRKKKRL